GLPARAVDGAVQGLGDDAVGVVLVPRAGGGGQHVGVPVGAQHLVGDVGERAVVLAPLEVGERVVGRAGHLAGGGVGRGGCAGGADVADPDRVAGGEGRVGGEPSPTDREGRNGGDHRLPTAGALAGAEPGGLGTVVGQLEVGGARPQGG